MDGERRGGRRFAVDAEILRKAITFALYAPAVVVLLVYAVGYLLHGWGMVRFPYQIDYTEAAELDRALRLGQGESIYVDWSQPPYRVANFTPLYPIVVSFFVSPTAPTFFVGRLVSFISTIATGLLLGATSWTLGARACGAAVTTLLYYSGYPVWNWGAVQRGDAFAVLVEVVGVLIFSVAFVRNSRRGMWLSVPVFVAAAYVRQTMVAGAFACYATLLLRRPRQGLALAGCYAGLGVGLLLLLTLVTHGQFVRHIMVPYWQSWKWSTFYVHWIAYFDYWHWAFALAGLGVLLRAKRGYPPVPALYLLAACALVLTMGKTGSNEHYLLETSAALALACGLAIGDSESLADASGPGTRATPVVTLTAVAMLRLVPAIILSIGVQQLYHTLHSTTAVGRPSSRAVDALRVLHWPVWRLDPLGRSPHILDQDYLSEYSGEPTVDDLESARLASLKVASAPGDILSEDTMFTVTTGKRLYLQPFEFIQLAEKGLWDERPLLQAVRERRFGAVILRFRLSSDPPSWHEERINRPLLEELRANYVTEAEIGSYYIYRPRR